MTDNTKETLEVIAQTLFPGSIMNHTDNNQEGMEEQGLLFTNGISPTWPLLLPNVTRDASLADQLTAEPYRYNNSQCITAYLHRMFD